MPPESEIRARVREGEVGAAATLVIRSFGPEVLRRLRAGLPREDEAREAFSRWAVSVWRGLGAFGWRSSLRTWALRVARNAALDVRGEAWRRRERPFVSGEISAIAAVTRTSSLDRDERRRQALAEISATLSQEERMLLELRATRRLPWAEIAAALSADGKVIDATAARKRFERLRRRLEQSVREMGLEP